MKPTLPAGSLETLFVDVIDSKVSSDVAERLFHNFMAQGMDPLRVVDDAGHNVLEAWWHHGGGEYGRSMPAAIAAAVAAVRPDVWTHTSGHVLKKTLAQHVLDRIGVGGSHSASVLAAWLKVLPLSEIVAHRGRHHEDRKPSIRGEALFLHALSSHRDNPEGSMEAVRVLRERGLKMASPAIGAAVKTAEQWTHFLADGGDPDALVDHRDDKPTPVWQVVRDRAPADCAAAVEAWARSCRAGRLAAEEDREYWAKLGRYGTASDLQKNARSRANWPSLVDSNGATVLMHLALANASAFQALAKSSKAWAPPARRDAEDKWGRNLWAYAWGNKHLDASIARVLLDNRVSPGPSSTGDGLLQQCLLRGVPTFGCHEMARTTTRPDWLVSVKKAVGEAAAAQALWGNEAAMNDLGDFLRINPEAYWGSKRGGLSGGPSSLVGLLAHLASEYPPENPPPSLRGALACICFVAGAPAVGSCLLEEGVAMTKLSDERAALVEGWITPEQRAQLAAADIGATLPEGSSSRSRLRM